MGFSFPSLSVNDLCLSLLIMRTRIFYSLVLRWYIRKVSVQLVPKYFHVIAVLILFHAANKKKRKKTILKQDSKSRKEDQNVVVVANPPG